MSGFDPDEAPRIARWPLREALLGWAQVQTREAREAFTVDAILYALQAPWQDEKSKLEPPKLPDILRS